MPAALIRIDEAGEGPVIVRDDERLSTDPGVRWRLVAECDDLGQAHALLHLLHADARRPQAETVGGPSRPPTGRCQRGRGVIASRVGVEDGDRQHPLPRLTRSVGPEPGEGRRQSENQYSSGRRTVVAERSASVMIQTRPWGRV